MEATIRNTIKDSNGQILTGRLWRKGHPSFNDLPFYTGIPRNEELAEPLQKALETLRLEGSFAVSLVKLAKGLDEVHPFSDTDRVDVVLREANNILRMDSVGAKDASRIWGFVSKFAMLDRFSKALGLAEDCTFKPKPKKCDTPEYFGTGSKLLEVIHPPTKVLEKFLKTWGEREKTRAQYSSDSTETSSVGKSSDGRNPSLDLARELITMVKAKNIVNIEAGMEMIALGMAISSENNGVFPEKASDVKDVITRIWSGRMKKEELGEISNEIHDLHRSIKNVIEIAFAISPLLALSTRGWSWPSLNSLYLIRLYVSLGNERPQILIRMEDCVLKGIIAISEGVPREKAMRTLYSELLSLKMDLDNDKNALSWFSLSPDTSPVPSIPTNSDFPSTPLPGGVPADIRFHLKEKLLAGELSSPAETLVNSPLFSTSSTLKNGNLSPLRYVNPRDLHNLAEDHLECHQGGDLMEQKGFVQSHMTTILPTLDFKCRGVHDDDEGDECSTMVGRSREPSLHPDEDDSTMVEGDEDSTMIGRSREPSLHPNEDDSTMVDVDSRQPSPHPAEDYDPMVDVDSREPLNNVEEEDDASAMMEPLSHQQDDDSTVVGIQSKQPSAQLQEDDASMVGVEAGELLSDSDKDVEDFQPQNEFDSSDSFDNGNLNEDSSIFVEPNELFSKSEKVDKKRRSANVANVPEATPTNGIESEEMSLSLESLALATFEPRRSTRNISSKNKPIVDIVPARKSTRSKKKPPLEKEDILSQNDSENETPKLSDVGKATFHPTLYANIKGWGSTVGAGRKPYRHVPVQIIPPGDVESTGDDTQTLRAVEAAIQANFKDGKPPHLQPDAKSMTYTPGDQSRIFVASHSEFSSLRDRDIQRILRNRLILVHGNPSDYDYKWDLESFGRIFDVDRETTVHVSTKFNPHNTDLQHHQGTLRDLHKITTTLSDDCPPINAISLPAHRRNLYIPSQFGSLASHEVAQSRLPPQYETIFKVPNIKSEMEWSLIGSKGSISPFHVDSAGLGTVVVVLEGSKYWIVMTRMGDDEIISSVDSLGPRWNPYFVNDEDNIKRFRFEGVHLQKGDMLIMPGGVPHWVLGTSNAICVGRHFYSKSNIRSSVVANVHTFLFTGAVTNQTLEGARTLLYQLLVFWSTRLDITDVDGAHIPDLSSEVEFLDLLYLGVFVILSTAYDDRFYHGQTPSDHLLEEAAFAVRHFRRLLHIFSQRFIVVLEGEAVSVSYVVDRILGEFAAASVVLARGIDEGRGDDGNDDAEDRITSSALAEQIESIIQKSHREVFPYYSRCLDRGHKDFLWTGPNIRILSRSDAPASAIPLMTKGEIVDLPSHQIYTEDVDANQPNLSGNVTQAGKRRDRADSVNHEGDMLKKRSRKC